MSAFPTMPARAAVLITSLLVTGMAATACDQAPGATCAPDGTQLHIAVLASLSHHFTKACLAAPSDEPFTIHFDNQDTSLHGNHNIHIVLPDQDFVGERAFHGTSVTYHVGPLSAGTYEFHCDEHLQMSGAFIVATQTSPAADTTT